MFYLKLIRYQNLLLLACMQLTLRYGFLIWQNCSLALSNLEFIILVIATICIAAGGYIINDIFDQETDSINKPEKVFVGKKITENCAYNLYVGITIVGVSLGWFLAYRVEKPNLFVLFIFISSLLYFYATTLKKMPLVGNITVAFLLANSVVIIGIFDLFPVVDIENRKNSLAVFGILMDYAIFAFAINLIREIVKDLEDIEGDKKLKMNTLAIFLGVSKTSKLLFCLGLTLVIALLNYCYHYFVLNDLRFISIFSIIFILAPLIYFLIMVLHAKNKNDFKKLSILLKWIIFFGFFMLPILHYTILHHA